LALSERDPQRAISLLDAAREREPGSRRIAQARAESFLQAWQDRIAPCDEHPSHCLEQIDLELRALEARAAVNPAAFDLPTTVLRARWYLASGQPERAHESLERSCPRAPDALPCLELWLQSAARLPSEPLARAVDAYVGVRCRDSAGCAQAELRVAQIFRDRGDLHVSLEHALRAAEHDAGWTGWALASEIALQLGRYGQARALAERARRAAPGDAVAEQRIESVLERLPPRH
jgi:tetratricopeptide (TPR) repeat protein